MNQNGSDDKFRVALILSRATAIILLLLYILYLVFQLRTHSNLFRAQGELEAEQPSLGAISAAAVLLVVTVLVAVCAEYLVGGIDDLVETANISKAFIGLILIPIVGNAAEHVTAVVVALRNKMDLAMGVAMGSSIQIALGLTPCLVILGWAIGQPMSLHFETCKFCNLYPWSQASLNLSNSRNGCICGVRLGSNIHGPGWQVQLLGRRHASGSLHDHCYRFLCHS